MDQVFNSATQRALEILGGRSDITDDDVAEVIGWAAAEFKIDDPKTRHQFYTYARGVIYETVGEIRAEVYGVLQIDS